MYLLLNLKDNVLSDVVQLLFSNGHTALSIAESVEDLCPTCERSSKSGLPFNVDRRKRGTPPKRLKNLPGQTSIFSTSVDTINGYNNIDLNDTADLNIMKPPSPHKVPGSVSASKVEVKHEPDEYRHNEVSCSVEIEDETPVNFNLSSALELLGHSSSAPCQDEVDLPCSSIPTVLHNLSSRKRIRVEELGLETFQCQLCKKSITRQGQYANLVNHLSRHARLHASKKQYCCPVCNAYYTRRYLAAAHVKEVHPDRPNVDPIDYGLELREEYKALLEVCFPGAEARKKIPNLSVDYRDEEDDDFTSDRIILNSAS